MYIHVFNSNRFQRTCYCDAPNPPVEIQSLDDGDGNIILSVVPFDLSVPIFCSDVNLKAKLSCGAPLNPVLPLQPHSLNVADTASSFLDNHKL